MIIQGNSYRIGLKDESVHCCVTSFPYYGLRSYGLPPTIWGGDSACPHIWESVVKHRASGGPQVQQTKYGKETSISDAQQDTLSQFCQLCGAWLGCFGLEPSISLHVQNAVAVCREIKRVLRRDGVFWLNYGDSYATGKNGRSAADTKAVGKDDRTFRDKPFSVTELPAKNLCMIPARVAIALQEDGWILRSEFPWLKLNAMPSSVTDRPGTAHEHVFMLVKSARYYFDMQAVRRGYSEKTEWTYPQPDKAARAGQTTNGTGNSSLRTQTESGRALRTSDPFFDSLDAAIAHLQDVRDNGGMLVAEWPGEANAEGLPAALVVNSEGFPGAHYATFPRKLIAPLIKTTPEKVCPNCSAAWVRVVEKEASDWGNRKANGATGGTLNKGHNTTHGVGTDHTLGKRKITPTGWQPTCKCDPELAPIPAVILDCFCGSGTVGQVARELGRRFIGIDLSATYLAENALPRSEKKMSLKALAQLPMFSEAA